MQEAEAQGFFVTEVAVEPVQIAAQIDPAPATTAPPNRRRQRRSRSNRWRSTSCSSRHRRS
eukprot:8843692-Prorocentrum_lima.AAC.1